MKLKSHASLIGLSTLADGETKKCDYLALASLKLNECLVDFVVKVGPRQTKLFGVDLIRNLNMNIDIPNMKYTLYPSLQSSLAMLRVSVLNFNELLERFKLSEKDLEFVENLPEPKQAYQMALSNGHSNRVLDLGATGFSLAADCRVV